MSLFRLALIRSLRNRTNAVLLLLPPLAIVCMPSAEYWPTVPYGYQYFGVLLLFLGIRLTSQIMEDRAQGIHRRLAAAPFSYFYYLVQHLLAYVLILGLLCVSVVVLGIAIGQPLHQPLRLLALYLSFSVTALALALVWISYYRNKHTSFLVYMSLVSLAVVASGLIVPHLLFPEWLIQVAYFLPTYWLAVGLDAVGTLAPESAWLQAIGILWLYTLLLMTLGSFRKLT